IEVDDIYKGIENVATTFGFSGIDPNTVMMGWTKTPETLIEFAKMTQNLVRLDYNILFLDFNKKTKFGNKESIDLWLRNTDGNNAEMMMNIGRFILQSPSWSKAKIRILFVNNTETEGSLVKAEITKITEKLRIGPEIKVISNSAEKLGIHKIIELESSETDLVIMGIPEGRVKEHVEFVKETDELFKSIGTTLLVKASNSFNVLDFDFSYDRLPQSREELNLKPLPVSEVEEVSDLVAEFDRHLSKTTNDLTSGAIAAISSIYMQFLESAELEITTILDECSATDSIQTISTRSIRAIRKIIRLSEDFAENKLISANGMLERDIYQFVSVRNRFLENVSKTVKIELPDIYPGARGSKTSKIYWRTILNYFARKKVLTNTRNSLFYFGVRSFSLINKLSKFVSEEHYLLLKNLANEKPDALPEFRRRISKVFDVLRDECIRLEQQTAVSLRTYERDTCADLVREIEDPEFNRRIRRLSRRLNRKDIAKNQLAVSEFSENWLRNQVSAHVQSAAALNLLTAGIRVFTTNERIKLYFENTVVGSQNSKIELLSAASDELKKDGKAKKPADLNTRKIEKLAEGIDYINFDNILDREEAGILRISGSMPVSVELMSADSFKSLLKDGARENERIALNLADVQGIIVQSHYLTPLQETKERLAGVSNEIAEEIYYIANLISHVIAKSGSETEGPAHKNIPKDVDERIQVCKTKLATTLDSFAHEIDTNLESTLSELSIFQILDSAETYRNTVRAPVVKSKLNDWYEQKRSELSGVYNNAVDFAIQRKQEIDTRKFEVADDKYLNKIEITSNFVRSLKVKPEVEKELPFYLEKLSVAGSAGKTHLSGKEENFRSAKQAIDRIKDGVSGAIMVVGESLSGRTYFTEAVARSLLRGERVHINPPSKQNFDVNDMHFAFQLAFERSGTTKAILEQANKNTVLIFNDLERWWIKSSNGDTVINYLAKMVEDYGNRHFFLFNSNIHSFQIIKETTDLERSLLSTIVLSPARKSELKEAILDRYHIAGVKLFYNGRPLSNARRVDALFAELFAKSNGKIGLALNTWGSNIEKDEEKNLSICVPQSLKFPDIKDPYWVILLYQLILHNRLTQTHIDELFGHEDRERVLMSLREMEKAELIYKQINDGYVLNSPAGHYVEIWLKGLGILG
ncbi:MAG: hypothetical protein HKN33_18710, partial [Pyrinomonadaceae bacterium]|nr:hypothetical protein [Pyrinomonadaceae bacterium]